MAHKGILRIAGIVVAAWVIFAFASVGIGTKAATTTPDGFQALQGAADDFQTRIAQTKTPTSTPTRPFVATPVPSWTPRPTETLDPSAFTMTSATAFKDPAGVVQILLPKGWNNIPTKPGDSPIKLTYRFAYGPFDSPILTLDLFVDEPKMIYDSILELPEPANTPQAALEAWKKSISSNPSLKIGDVKPAKLGKSSGFSLLITVQSQSGGGGGQEVEVRAAMLEDGKLALVFIQSRDTGLWTRAQDVLPQMLESIDINTTKVPTPTMTFTPHPLEITATALANLVATNRAQILALTPSGTPTRTP